jgi:hypothetical protein
MNFRRRRKPIVYIWFHSNKDYVYITKTECYIHFKIINVKNLNLNRIIK